MKPTEVNQPEFPVNADDILYSFTDEHEGLEFTIAWSTWDGGNKCLGMRWNHFPKGVNGRPIWHVIPTDLAIPILTSLCAMHPAKADEAQTVTTTSTREINYAAVLRALEEAFASAVRPPLPE